MASINSSSGHLIGIPPIVYENIATPDKGISVAIHNIETIGQQEEAWKNAAKSLNLNVEKPLSGRVTKETTEVHNKEHSKTTSSQNIDVYQHAINHHYKTLNESFIHEFHTAIESIRGVEGYNKEGIAQLAASLPENDKDVSDIEFHITLRKFIHDHKDSEVFDSMLYACVENIALLKMLIQVGIKPTETPIEGDFDKRSLSIATLVSLKSDFPTNLAFCKLVISHNQIDQKGLTYLLWLACQTEAADENEQLNVIKFLVENGAKFDVNLLADYPPFALSGDDNPTTFINQHTEKKEHITNFIHDHSVAIKK